ncbi:hypothetical protein, partial [Achromobacter insuavis]|uniref:hypothetical protein n=1 Tax=Achromobacter insuavis TaxID=1287735 RepID=UPI0035A055C9
MAVNAPFSDADQLHLAVPMRHFLPRGQRLHHLFLKNCRDVPEGIFFDLKRFFITQHAFFLISSRHNKILLFLGDIILYISH